MKNIFILVIHLPDVSYSSQLECGFTANECQAWTNYENKGN